MNGYNNVTHDDAPAVKQGIGKSMKGKGILLAGIAAGLLLIILPTVISGFTEKKSDAVAPVSEKESTYYTEFLEEKIQKLCLGITGIYKAEVLLTLDTSSEYVYAANSSEVNETDRTSVTKDYLIIDNSDGDGETVMVSEIYPRIRGVAVVCTGGDSSEVQQKVTELLGAALGLSSARIKVAGAG